MKKRFPHTYVIIFYIIIFSALLTWIIPGGEFNRKVTEIDGIEREIIITDSYHKVDKNPQTWQIFSALINGFISRANIIAFILIIGGAFWIMNQTQSLGLGIQSFIRYIRKLEKYKLFKSLGIENLVLVFIMLLFSVFGATFGMSEETIAFTIIFVPLAVSMGYDSIVGVAMCFVAAALGFAGAILNPFTIGIAQGLSDLPIFSGIEYRFLCWIIINLVGIGYLITYAKKIKKAPKKSSMYELDKKWKNTNILKSADIKYSKTKSSWISFILILLILIISSFLFPVSSINLGNLSFLFPVIPVITAIFVISSILFLRKDVHYFILNLLIFTILFLIIGVIAYKWFIIEIAALFLAFGIFCGISMNYSPNTITKHFIDGLKDIASAALVVGLAGGIIIILEEGKVIDTLLYYASNSMKDLGRIPSIGIMYILQTFINIFIPSGSAQAALTIPIMAPFSDLIGISRQTVVMVFQFGDGFTNLITPTSGVLIGVLGVAKIPYDKWFRWALPFVLILILTGFLLLIPTVIFNLNGF